MLMLKLALNGPMAKNESTITCLIVNEVHSIASRTKRGSVFSFFTVRNVAVGVYFEDDGVLRSFGLCF